MLLYIPNEPAVNAQGRAVANNVYQNFGTKPHRQVSFDLTLIYSQKVLYLSSHNQNHLAWIFIIIYLGGAAPKYSARDLNTVSETAD